MTQQRAIGTPFDTYEPLRSRVVVKETNFAKILLKDGKDLNHIPRYRRAMAPDYHPNFAYSISKDDARDDLKSVMDDNYISVAPAANVVNVQDFVIKGASDISASIKQGMTTFDYYIIEVGFNVVLSKGYKIPDLKFFVQLYGDGEMTPDVVSYSSLPTDKINHVERIGGEIGVSLTPFLKLVPAPIGKVLSDVLTVKLNPWKFSWGYDQIEIDFSGDLDYNLIWKLKRDNIFTGFRPVIVIKKKKTVSKVTAKVRAIYTLQIPKETKLQLRPCVQLESSEKEIQLIP